MHITCFTRNSNALEIVELENTYTAEVTGTDTGSRYSVTITDAAGNIKTLPQATSTKAITLASNNANPRVASHTDKVTITIYRSEESETTTAPTVTVGGNAVAVTAIGSGSRKVFEYEFTAHKSQHGEVLVTHDDYSQISSLSRVVLDNTTPSVTGTPTLTTTNSDNTKAETGDTLTLSVTTNEEVSISNATLGGESVNFIRNVSHEGKITNGTAALSSPRSVFVQGDYAYVASFSSNALEIVNISNPATPTHVGKIYNGRSTGKDNNGNEYTSQSSDVSGAELNKPRSVFVQGDYAYVISENSHPNYNGALEIIDITEKDNPKHKGKIYRGRTDGTATSALSADGNGAALGWPTSVFVQGDYAYIASRNSNALEIVNISNPTNPTHAGKIYRGRTDGTATSALTSDGTGAALERAHAVFVQGDYAYVVSHGSGGALEIVDISTPTNPTHIGKIHNGRLDGTHTSAGANNGVVFSNPNSVFVQGDYAYVVSNSGFNIIDIGDNTTKSNPKYKGKIISSHIQSVFVQGNYAYISSSISNAFEIIDISDSASPTYAGKIIDGIGGAALNQPYSVFVQGNYAYVASAGSNALEIIELENTYTTSIPITRQVANNRAFNSYSATIKDAVGNTRNVSRTFTAITTDIPPLDITSYSDTVNGARDGYINSEETTGNLITALGVRAGTAQYAVTTPTTNCNANALTYTTTIPTTTSLSTDTTYKVCARVVNGTKTSYNHDILITKDTVAPSTTEDPTLTTSNNNLTLTVKTNEEVSLDDITLGTQNPTNFLRNISHEGSIANGNGGASIFWPLSVFVRGDYAYITSQITDVLEIVNISNPASPTHIGKIYNGRASGKDSSNNEYTSSGKDINGAALDDPYSVFVQGDYAYIASYNSNALEIVDISTPSNPRHAGKIINGAGGAELSRPQSVFVQGNYAYVASSTSNALEIIDISDPANPIHTGKITNGTGGAALNQPISVFVKGNYAYVASQNSHALEIVNISDPANPTHAGKLTNGSGGARLSSPSSVFVQGDYAYVVSTSSDALQIVNISNPATPTSAGNIRNGQGGTVLNNPRSIFVRGNYAYIASQSSSALQVVNISDPENPTHAGKITNGTGGALLNNPRSVFILGNYAYIASQYSNVLEIVELENTYTAEVTGTDTSSAYGVTTKDIAGNSVRLGTIKLASTKAITLASDNANPRVASHTDKVTITIYRSEESETTKAPTVTVGGNAVTVTAIGSGSRKVFEYEFTAHKSQHGEVLVTHDGYSQISSLSRVVLDNTTPSVTGTPTLTTTNSDNTKAEIGDTVKLTVTTNEEVSISNATLGGESVNLLRNISHEGVIRNGTAALNIPRSVFIQGNYAYVASSIFKRT